MYYIKICITVCVPSHGFVNVKQNLKLLKRSLKYFLSLLILKETGQVGKGREREREREERENPKQVPCCHLRAWRGAWTHETLRSWPELKPRVGLSINWATQVTLKGSFRCEIVIKLSWYHYLHYILYGLKCYRCWILKN